MCWFGCRMMLSCLGMRRLSRLWVLSLVFVFFVFLGGWMWLAWFWFWFIGE